MGRLIFFCAAWIGLWGFPGQAGADPLYVAGADGVYAFEFDAKTGQLSPPILGATLKTPSCIAAHPTGWFLFAASNDGQGGASVSSHLISFFVDPNAGTLHEINRVETGGNGVSHIEVDARRGAVFVANDERGAVAAFPLGVDGKLGPRALWMEYEGSSVALPRQSRPHPKEVQVSPDGRHVYVPDLGTDEIFIYEFGEQGALKPAAVPSTKVGEGDGPCHLDFHPSLSLAYLSNEISSRISVFQRNTHDGSLTAVQSVASLPGAFRGKNLCGPIRVHPGGGLLYASNCGQHSIAAYRLNEQGFLSLIGYESAGGKAPVDLVIHPSGKWLLVCNRDSGALVVFSIDPKSGKLARVGDPVPVWSPISLIFAPAP